MKTRPLLRSLLVTALTTPIAALASASPAQALECGVRNQGSHTHIYVATEVKHGMCLNETVFKISAGYTDHAQRFGHFQATGPNGHIGNSREDKYGDYALSGWDFFHRSGARGTYCVIFWEKRGGGHVALDRNCTKW